MDRHVKNLVDLGWPETREFLDPMAGDGRWIGSGFLFRQKSTLNCAEY